MRTMELARHQLTALDAPDALADSGDELTTQQDLFAQAWARTGNRATAYREAYNVGPKTLPATVWANASRLAALPKVLARYEQCHQLALQKTIYSVIELFQHQVDIATADPNELVRVVQRNCRHCHGFDFGYQWTNEGEYLDACAVAIDKQEPSPSESGGYGFNGALEPHPLCPHCFGVGIPQTILADTTKLSRKAARLYAGAEQDRYGMIKIKMHDQQKAAELAGRIMGAFNDKLDLRTPEQRAAAEQMKTLPVNVTAEDAARAYAALLTVTG